jgi:hypothetical protein
MGDRTDRSSMAASPRQPENERVKRERERPWSTARIIGSRFLRDRNAHIHILQTRVLPRPLPWEEQVVVRWLERGRENDGNGSSRRASGRTGPRSGIRSGAWLRSMRRGTRAGLPTGRSSGRGASCRSSGTRRHRPFRHRPRASGLADDLRLRGVLLGLIASLLGRTHNMARPRSGARKP